jgi:chromosome segregation ATPase
MKLLEALFDDAPNVAVNRRGSAGRGKKSADAARDAEGRRWPVLPAIPQNDISALEKTIAKQSAELNLRCTQVADLYNVQQQQANELQTACEEIDRLSDTISTLLDTTARYETEAVATKKKLTLLENEKAALRAQLDKALEDSSKMTQRLLAVETAFNDRETSVASALEKAESLKAELTTESAERFKLVAAAERQKQRHRVELNQLKSGFESQIRKSETLVVSQDVQIKGLEEVRDRAVKRVEILEALLSSEREGAQFKIKELTEELQRERLGHSAEDRAAAAMRKEIVFLLPKLAARKDQSNTCGLGNLVPQNNAA